VSGILARLSLYSLTQPDEPLRALAQNWRILCVEHVQRSRVLLRSKFDQILRIEKNPDNCDELGDPYSHFFSKKPSSFSDPGGGSKGGSAGAAGIW